jgi:hypothetical protein
MMLGLQMVAMGEMKMVMGLLMMTGLMSAGRFLVMLGTMLMVFCGFLVVVREPLMIHRTSPPMPPKPRITVARFETYQWPKSTLGS